LNDNVLGVRPASEACAPPLSGCSIAAYKESPFCDIEHLANTRFAPTRGRSGFGIGIAIGIGVDIETDYDSDTDTD
jgi:hypothetical protein